MVRVISSRTVFNGRLFSVKQDILESKGRRLLREFVVHPGAVAVIAVDDDGQLYLVKQYRHAVGAELLEIPAGTLEDEDPKECAERELREETGFKASVFDKLAEFYLAPGYSNELLHLYLARGLTKTSASPEADEEISLVRVSVEEALKMVLKGEIKDAKTIASLLLFREIYGIR